MMIRGRISRSQSVLYAFQGLGFGLILVLVSAIDFSSPWLTVTPLFLPAAAIYLWPYRADYGVSVFCALLIGLFQDLVSGGPLGLFALSYALLYAVTNPAQQILPRAKISNIVIYSLWCLALSAMTSIFGALSLGKFPNLVTLLACGLLSILLFAVIFWFRDILNALTGRVDLRRART
ncbi:hypothetical protein [Robiginitomaculum antarcticum]|uniref:hypothetical protein n=1 Tax=Robiginitomaculum antarcticum TaxID=437507 RepID=UPI000382E320|nr:hypothetical protein [Robiginitomaculum antarcticum]